MRRLSSLFYLLLVLLVFGIESPPASATLAVEPGWFSKLDPLLQSRAQSLTGRSRIVALARDAAALPLLGPLITQLGGISGRELAIVNGLAADVPNASLPALASDQLVEHLSLDRVIAGSLGRTAATIGSAGVRLDLGYDGAGVGVAVIDSGITQWHDDLSASAGGQRVAAFVDFVNHAPAPYDDYGHGTHVAGIIAGDGFDSSGGRAGIAPGVHLIVLKVLDQSGSGRISDVIAALQYVESHRTSLNIRIANLSVATGVYESYLKDPLTLAARRVVEAGVVVVAAAGNRGRDPQGRRVYGGITAPGNAPWVLTVGASSHMGTIARGDDTIAPFSSRGPAAVDYVGKPDVVAPGVGIESLSDPASSVYTTKAPYLLPGSVPTAYLPYLSLSGTSMAAPAVSGTIALMLQANPALTPNAVKAILEYTAQTDPGYDALTQGAGFVNAKGAVELARALSPASPSQALDTSGWARHLIWGNRLFEGGWLTSDANAWSAARIWGAPDGAPIEWGTICTAANCDAAENWTRWDTTAASSNVVWGSACGGSDCTTSWSPSTAGDATTAADDDDTVVWGTDDDGDTVVWGTDGDDGDTIVWGTSCSDPSCEPVIWE